jgi:hypothetical protein
LLQLFLRLKIIVCILRVIVEKRMLSYLVCASPLVAALVHTV